MDFSGTNIAIIGSTMMDLVVYAEKLPEPGETRIGKNFITSFGGKGANQAVMAARTGSNVTFITGIGTDSFGDACYQNFLDCGFDTTTVMRFDVHTGIAHIWVDGQGQNRIVIVPGANYCLSPITVTNQIENLNRVKILVAQCEIPQEVTLAAFIAAKKKGITTILNPAPFQPLSPELLNVTDWLIPNEIELSELSNGSVDPYADESLARFRNNGRLLVTLGSSGAALVNTDGKVTRFSAKAVSAVDTTGAGDCFIGAFASALAFGASEESSVKFGIDCATNSVVRKGAQSSFPTKIEIDFSQILK